MCATRAGPAAGSRAVLTYVLAPIPNVVIKRFFSDNMVAGYVPCAVPRRVRRRMARTSRSCRYPRARRPPPSHAHSGTAADMGYFITAVLMVTGLGAPLRARLA